jgi:hypothetical protein
LKTTLYRSIYEDDIILFEDEEEIRDIASRYLLAKYKGCDEDGCRMFCDRDEAREVLRTVLPPISKEELEKEVDITMKDFGADETIAESEFIQAILDNTYWKEAGPVVVKELMFLDALHAHYYDKFSLLDDDDYDTLKENLTWEGSAVATMLGKEAHFITAVAANRRGQPILSNDEYELLKSELKEASSWVTSREADKLEQAGMETFIGYLHRSME